MKKISVSKLLVSLKVMTVRFLFPVLLTLGLALLFFISINYSDIDIAEKWWVFLSVGFPISFSFSLFAEDFKNKLWRMLIPAGILLLFGVYVLLLPEKLPSFLMYQLIAIAISATLASFVVSFYRRNDAEVFWEFSKNLLKQLVISHVFSTVLMMGLSLAVVSLEQLFKINIQSEVYQNLAILCFVIFAAFYFLSNIPAGTDKFKTELESSKFIKILGLYILLPILLVYVLILYVYLVQIVTAWELPEGWVSWLVTALALAGFATLMCQYPLRGQKNKLAGYFARYFPIVLLPLLILMSVGIYRRIADYGWTINRAYVFVFNIWLYGITIYLLLSQSKYLKYIVSSFVLIAFLSSVGPWSVFAFTKAKLLTETREILISNHYLENDQVRPLNEIKTLNVAEEDKKKLSQKLKYLTSEYGSSVLQSLFAVDISNSSHKDIHRLLNLIYADINYQPNELYSYHLKENNDSFNIEQYSDMMRLSVRGYIEGNNNPVVQFNSDNNQFAVEKDGKTYLIPMNAVMQKLRHSSESNAASASLLTFEMTHCTLIVEYINFSKHTAESEFQLTNLQGWLLFKTK